MQQQAIQIVRTRYEQGILTFEQFEDAINALLLAHTPQECQKVIDELPSPAATSVPPASTQPKVPGPPVTEHIVGTLGELKRMQSPWRLGQQTRVRMWLGQVKLDLSLATLPPNGVLEVVVPVGEIVIYVPQQVHVTVRALALIGEVKVLGEERSGMWTRVHTEEFPIEGNPAVPAPHMDLRLKTMIGSVKVIRVKGPVFGFKERIKEVAGQLLLATLDAFKQHRNDHGLPQ